LAWPGEARVMAAGWNAAVKPVVAATSSAAAAAARIVEAVCEGATAVRSNVPGRANVTAPGPVGTRRDPPRAPATLGPPRVATSAPGPPSARSKVSRALPVLVTVSPYESPGLPDVGESATFTPPARTLSVPFVAPLTDDFAVAAALTEKESGPGVIPAA